MARGAGDAGTGERLAALRDVAMRGEPDRYLAATLAPAGQRLPLAAVAAFAAELQRIPASVSEPMLGSIRLQWWRDVIAAALARGDRPGHPVADAFADVARARDIDPADIESMLEAREHDLSGGLPSDDAGLWAYLDATEGAAFRMSLAVAGVPRAVAAPLATAAGRSYGIARALGRLPMLHHNGGLPLPADRLKATGVDLEALATQPPSPDVAAAVAEVARDLTSLARAALAEARGLARSLPSSARAALLPLAMVEPYFRAQRPSPRLDVAADVSPLSRVMRIGLAYAIGRA